jgi:hypothetical protein
MPIRRYFLVIAPLLAGLIWFIGSYMEPTPPVRAQSAKTTQAVKPGSTASAQAASPMPLAPVQAAKPATQVRVEPTAIPLTTAQGAPPRSLEINEPAASERPASAEPNRAPVQTAQKRKKRKQMAQRRHQGNYASTARRQYQETPRSNAPYYAYAPPFGRWPW